MNSKDDYNDLLGIYKNLSEHIDNFRDSSDSAYRESWIQRAGAIVPSMLASREGALAGLSNASPAIRDVALQILTYHWPVQRGLSDACEQLIVQDPDQDVRVQAIYSLGACYARTEDARVSRLLALLIANKSEYYYARCAAYLELLRINNMTDDKFELKYSQSMNVSIDNDIDYVFVNQFCR